MPALDVTPEQTAAALDGIFLEMLGEDISAAIVSARARLGDATIMVRINMGLASVERAGALVVEGLGPDDVAAHLETMA
jgi:hypothetical protein